jgi:anaerobic selenocysteine-containing dehydrogenase
MFFLCIGANPVVSNGSVMAAPGMARRLAALRARGGQCVVVDPRRTETARLAGRHYFIHPGADALLLLAMLSVVFEERLARDRTLFQPVDGLDRVEALAREFPPERAAGAVGIPAGEVRRLTREFAAAPSAVCYGRVGVSTQEHGALACWLIQVLNIATGNFDRAGGAMFSRPALDLPALARWTGDAGHFATFRSSVRGLPEFADELPVAALADEIETDGPLRIRALISFAGNPVLSAPNGGRLERALGRLEFFVAIDPYANATNRFANVILPPTSPLERDHYPLISHLVAVRNTAKYSQRAVPPPPGALHDWEILLAIKSGLDRSAPMAARALKLVENALLKRLGPAGLLDLGLRLGPYGLRRALWNGLSLRALRDAPHGVDLGALAPGLSRRLLGRPVNAAPQPLVDDLARLRSKLSAQDVAGLALRLIGRRQVRTNNSWLHNCRDALAGPRASCALMIHPLDARTRGIAHGDLVRVRSRTGSVAVRAEVSPDIMPGVVSLPHGWRGARHVGDQAPGADGVSVNDVTDDHRVDGLAGTAAFSGVAVDVTVAVRDDPEGATETMERTAI